jgi:hypothetical protein
MSLATAIQTLVSQGYTVKFERHPASALHVGVSLSKRGFVQRGSSLVCSDDALCGILREAKVRLDIYLKIRRENG